MNKTEGKVFFYAYGKGTCTKGKACAYARAKETSSPHAAGKAAGGTETPCRFFAQGTCKLRDSCKDRHGSPGNGKSKGKGNGKGTNGSSASPAAAAAAMYAKALLIDDTLTVRLSGLLSLRQSSFTTTLTTTTTPTILLPGRTCDHGLWTQAASTT